MGSILWAEDSPDDQRLIREAMRHLPDPPAVEFAEDGAALLARLGEARPNLIVLDLGMPGMGGMEALERLQGMGLKLGVIVFTSHNGPGEARQCRARGAHDVIQKPTDYYEFVAAIQRIVTHRAMTMGDEGGAGRTAMAVP
jgi:CheY-like chemotaxis protein